MDCCIAKNGTFITVFSVSRLDASTVTSGRSFFNGLSCGTFFLRGVLREGRFITTEREIISDSSPIKE